ncbi:hypothetical protein OH76DRAFT_1407363 [Lentinus brumalis]|nr:hypothetical protein OH76DRAFT_1407363 [Polyporus brumalis]
MEAKGGHEILAQVNSIGVQTEPSLRHDDEFWFDRGNLVLVASNLEFRVWKAPLIKHSPVFRDMLSLPQDAGSTRMPSNGAFASRTVTGSAAPAVVHLSDPSEDLRHFLRAFFPGKTLRPMGRLDPPYEELAAQIRLGHKYEVDQMVQRNLDYLKQYYVDEYFAWIDAPTIDLEPRGFEEKHTIGVVNLARLTGTDSILSTALMHASLLDPALIAEGFQREDGSREMLSMDDIGRVSCGKQDHIKGTIWSLHRLFARGVSEGCVHPTRCENIMQKLQDRVMSDDIDQTLGEYDWWGSVEPIISREDKERELCWSCYNSIINTWEDLVKTLFDRLPSQLGLQVEEA